MEGNLVHEEAIAVCNLFADPQESFRIEVKQESAPVIERSLAEAVDLLEYNGLSLGRVLRMLIV